MPMTPGVLEDEVDPLDFAHNVLGLAEAEPDESQVIRETEKGEGMPGGQPQKLRYNISRVEISPVIGVK